jgi:SAM-dependent methyltransferase
VVLDVRSADAFALGHVPESGNIPWGELPERVTELPPRDTPLLIVAEDATSAERAARWLGARATRAIEFLAAPVEQLEVSGWSVEPPARLWRPAPFLEHVLPRIRGDLATNGTPRAADLACGSGRDAVFLALAGFEVEGWDDDPFALEQARALAARHGVRLETIRCDLESRTVDLPRERYDLVICFRFLQRPLFRAIANSMAPGGWLAYETFRRGQEQFGKPRRTRFLLKDGELRRSFPNLEIVEYDEPSPREGPWTARLLARRR